MVHALVCTLISAYMMEPYNNRKSQLSIANVINVLTSDFEYLQ